MMFLQDLNINKLRYWSLEIRQNACRFLGLEKNTGASGSAQIFSNYQPCSKCVKQLFIHISAQVRQQKK
jgi:hypothetical protein